jgi:hypothetical protein
LIGNDESRKDSPMLANPRSRVTYANVMATVAVFIALGGSSYAALRVTGRHVPKDALTGADIKHLTGRDVRNNSLTGSDVKNLTSADITNGALRAEDFAPGQLPAGPRGETGPAGLPGTTGQSMLTGSTENGAIEPLSGGGSEALNLPPSGVATFAEGSSVQLTPHAAVAADALTVQVENAPPANAALRFIFSVNGILTELHCVIPAGQKSCTDFATVEEIGQDSEITLVVDNPGSAESVATGARWGWRVAML